MICRRVLSIFLGCLCLLAIGAEAAETSLINVHEHIQSLETAAAYLEAADRTGVAETVLLGSPEATLYAGRQGFEGEEANNAELFRIAKAYPGKFILFPTIDVSDPGKLEKLKTYLQQGARGLKLYHGHSFFHTIRLDDPVMDEIYAYCEKNRVPVMFHVNPGYYLEEFENVLKRYPDMKVICPHFCLSTIRSDRLEYLMDTYPNLYTDTSFGFIRYLNAGLMRFSRDPEKYRKLIQKYQDRVFFGTDMVVTDSDYKTVDWFAQTITGYRDLLEKRHYRFFLLEGQTLNGLNLDRKVLEKIYRTNFERLMDGSRRPS